ncbi:hypothetical protein K3495_g11279 [Podosphaera aphanis]|nr:hypothetical protein K3495_g11279 [Podosphaera aphanis]
MSAVAETHTYKSKWGDIEILTESNFSEWRVTCELALVNAGVFEIVNGENTRPAAVEISNPSTDSTKEQEWITHACQAQVIVTNSVRGQLKEMSLEFAKKTDPAGLWKALLDLDPNKDPTNIDTLRESFYSVKMDQSKDTIQSVLLRLNNIRAKLSE